MAAPSSTVKVKITKNNFSAFSRRADGASKRVSIKMAALAAGRARGLAPVRTGALQKSIGTSVSLSRAGKSRGVVVCDSPYGLFEELGSKHNRPHHFVARAVHEIEPLIVRDFAGKLT